MINEWNIFFITVLLISNTLITVSFSFNVFHIFKSYRKEVFVSEGKKKSCMALDLVNMKSVALTQSCVLLKTAIQKASRPA